MRGLWVVVAAGAFGSAAAQAPHVSFSADVYPQLRYSPNGQSQARLYNDFGEYSIFRLGIVLDNGWAVRLRQRLERIPGDADNSSMDEAFLENPGRWKAGKQYIPFGSGRMLRESAFGVQVETEFDFASLPVVFGYFDSGRGKQSGFVARVGGSVGVSVAVGDHFGIAASSFTQLRLPEESPGRNRGYGLAVGIDVTRKFGGWTLGVEGIALRRAASPLDRDTEVVDASLSYQFPYGPLVEGGATLETESGLVNLRLVSEMALSQKLFLVPSVRHFEGRGWIIGVGARIRL